MLEVTVNREPEWDDESRAEMLSLAEYEAGICECGFHKSLTRDKANRFSFEVDHCPVCAGVAQYGRLQARDDAEEEEKLGKSAPPAAKRPADGRHVLMAMTRGSAANEGGSDHDHEGDRADRAQQ